MQSNIPDNEEHREAQFGDVVKKHEETLSFNIPDKLSEFITLLEQAELFDLTDLIVFKTKVQNKNYLIHILEIPNETSKTNS